MENRLCHKPLQATPANASHRVRQGNNCGAPQTPSAFSDLVSVLVMVGLPAGPANRALSRHAIDPFARRGRGERLQRPCPPATLPRCLWDPTGSRTLSSACVWPLLRPMRRSSSRVTVGESCWCGLDQRVLHRVVNRRRQNPCGWGSIVMIAGRVALAGVPADDPARDYPADHAWRTVSLTGQCATACDCAPAPVTSATFFASLRMPKPEMISTTPSTTSQMPATNASVTMESKG